MTSKLYDLKEIIAETGLPERTVRYYLSKVLEAPPGTPGRKSYYDQVTVDQLMLAQQILMRDYDPEKGEVKPTLKAFRDWLDGLDEAEVRRLVEMPYKVMPKALMQERPVVRSVRSLHARDWGGRTYNASSNLASEPQPGKQERYDAMDSVEKDAESFDSMDFPAFLKAPSKEDKTEDNAKLQDQNPEKKHGRGLGRDSASDYLDRVMGAPSTPSAAGRSERQVSDRSRRSGRNQAPWQSHRFGDALEIRTRQPLSREQARQLRLAGQLLESILEGESS